MMGIDGSCRQCQFSYGMAHILRPSLISSSGCLDGDEDTNGAMLLLDAACSAAGESDGGACWRSRGGDESAALLTLHFPSLVDVSSVEISFAAGFAARTTRVFASREALAASSRARACDEDHDAPWVLVKAQGTDAEAHGSQAVVFPEIVRGVRALRCEFSCASDLYGRLICYRVAAVGPAAVGPA